MFIFPKNIKGFFGAKLTFSPERSVGENEFFGMQCRKMYKKTNFDSTSFPQNSFSPTLCFGENVNFRDVM